MMMGTQYVFECFNCLGEGEGCPHCDGKGTMNRVQLDAWREFIIERVARAEAPTAEVEHALAHFRARIEAAEAENTALRAELGTALDHLETAMHYLEVLQAAQQWRPVTTEWPPYGVQHLGRSMLNSPTLLITRQLGDEGDEWQDTDGLVFYADEIRFCAAIPVAHQEPTP